VSRTGNRPGRSSKSSALKQPSMSSRWTFIRRSPGQSSTDCLAVDNPDHSERQLTSGITLPNAGRSSRGRYPNLVGRLMTGPGNSAKADHQTANRSKAVNCSSLGRSSSNAMPPRLTIQPTSWPISSLKTSSQTSSWRTSWTISWPISSPTSSLSWLPW